MQSAEQIVVSMLAGVGCPITLAQWVDEYNRLEHEANMGRGSKVQDERMNMIFDYLLTAVAKKEQE